MWYAIKKNIRIKLILLLIVKIIISDIQYLCERCNHSILCVQPIFIINNEYILKEIPLVYNNNLQAYTYVKLRTQNFTNTRVIKAPINTENTRK